MRFCFAVFFALLYACVFLLMFSRLKCLVTLNCCTCLFVFKRLEWCFNSNISSLFRLSNSTNQSYFLIWYPLSDFWDATSKWCLEELDFAKPEVDKTSTY